MEVEALRESLDQLKLLRTQAEGLIGRISNNFKTDALLNVGIAKEAIDILQKTIIEQEKILSVQELTDINKISYMADVEKAIDELLEQNKLKQQRHDILLILGRLLYITGDENVEAVKTEVSEFMAEAKSLPIDNFIEKADKVEEKDNKGKAKRITPSDKIKNIILESLDYSTAFAKIY